MWKIGDRLKNRYQVLEILGGPGKSGMGIIYVCIDLMHKITLAVKTFQDQYLENKKAIDRFVWEAEAWVRLERHQNIVPAYYVDKIEDRPYIFLEYIIGDKKYGTGLNGWIYGGGLRKSGEPDISQILNFAIQFCYGMMHAQDKFKAMHVPFVHRDIKPQNILVTWDKVVKITDFGLVKSFRDLEVDIEASGGDNKPCFFSHRGIYGTPPYMSPEQCRGDQEIDIRSDIYAFGCVLYEMLTGNYVFKARKPQEFIYHHLHTQLSPPGLGTELDGIIMKCLAKEPQNRYLNFHELEKELSDVYYNISGLRMQPPPGIKLPLYEEAYFKGLSFEALGMLRFELKPGDFNPDSADDRFKLGNTYYKEGRFDQAITEYKEALRINPAYAQVHLQLGNAYGEKAKLDLAIEEYKEALCINPDYAEAHNNLGGALANSGNYDQAIAELNEALKIKPNEPKYLYHLGLIYYNYGRLEKSIDTCKEVLRLNPEYAKVHKVLAAAYYSQGKYDDAVLEYKIALKHDPADNTLRIYLGKAYGLLGTWDLAISEYNEVLKTDPYSFEAHKCLGIAYKNTGKLDAAISEYKHALRINCEFVEAHYNLAIAYNALGKLDEALVEYREALRIKPGFAEARYNLGVVYQQKGQRQDAIKCFQEFIRIASPKHASHIKQAQENIRQLKER
jgi:tetratricopeptide (TPR) repeat protein/tRNA A-37 threonylcarbamoyl transferase component Bud32